MKINILFEFKEGPWGGGNQFLKALRNTLITKKLYTDNPSEANIILFNSYPFNAEYLFRKLYNIKKKYPDKLILYRVDGPISLIRQKDKAVDKIISIFNDIFVDGIIFQSQWSAQKNKQIFKIKQNNETIIYNAPDNSIFNNTKNHQLKLQKKIKLIATSWSGNKDKGFAVYKYLDNNLDFTKYTFKFIGNTPLNFIFRNITHTKPLPSHELSKEIKKADIFITASKNDPCSNSLIEALSCGLPAIVLNDGGHPELINKGGETFNCKEEIITKIEKISQNYASYQKQLPLYDIISATNSYIKFAKEIYFDKNYTPKKITFRKKSKFLYMYFIIFKWKMLNITKFILLKIWKN